MVLGERMEDIREVDEAKEEEDLVGVVGRSFATIAECQDTMHRSVRIRHARHVNTTLNFTTQSKNVMC